ncbi:MAG: protein jag, partial [Sulfurimonadaceae bacterium]|nr:protein jag [Sulfurimonadaceae bacterium]
KEVESSPIQTSSTEEVAKKTTPSIRKPYKPAQTKQEPVQNLFQDTIMPQSFVSMQDEDEDTYYEPVYADEDDEEEEIFNTKAMDEIAQEVRKELNVLFKTICFELDEIDVSVYDVHTLLIEFKGEDAALLIGKEGYRYKALSYMLFNWINAKYQVGLRLEIAEFLKNQEEAVAKYLENVSDIVAKEGRAQTKILDGVLIQIALKELRDMYPDKYVAIRSTRDGLKYIIINDYHAK